MLEDRDLDARALGSGRIDGYVNVKSVDLVSVEAPSGVLDASITMGPWMPVPEVPEGRVKVKLGYILKYIRGAKRRALLLEDARASEALALGSGRSGEG